MSFYSPRLYTNNIRVFYRYSTGTVLLFRPAGIHLNTPRRRVLLMAFLVMLVSLLLREVPYREVPHTLLMAFLFMLISLLLMEVSYTALSLRNPMILSASARGAPGSPPCSGGA